MANQYGYGRKKEHKAARQLRRTGASVKLSPGSRTSKDMVASFPTGTEWAVQVKATRGRVARSPSRQDLANLKRSATRTGRTPVAAKVTRKGIEYRSARSNRKLTPPKHR